MADTLAPIYPFMRGTTVSQNFGQFPGGYNPWAGHTGKDFAVPVGTPIFAAEDGVIEFEGWVTGQWYENAWWFVAGSINIVLNAGDHKNTYTYGHLNETIVSQGQYVKRGQIIGYSGNTGQSTGPHCHFEVLPPNWDYNNGTYGRINPDTVCVYWDGKQPVVDTPTIPSTSNLFAIDVSNHQRDINIAAINPAMVIIRASEGAGITDEWMAANVMKARNAGKPVGLYHYAHAMEMSGNTPQAEARYYIDAVKPHYKPGDKIILDWEGRYIQRGAGWWAVEWFDQVCRELGAAPEDCWFYSYTSILTEYDAGLAPVKAKYSSLWYAFYGNETFNSWGDPADHYRTPTIPAGWRVVGWQYTQNGRVPGYGSNLDLNIIYTNGDDDMEVTALSKEALQAIANYLLNHPAWGGPNADKTKVPTWSQHMLNNDTAFLQVNEKLSTCITVLGRLATKPNGATQAEIKALLDQLGTGSTTPGAAPVLADKYEVILKKVDE